MKVVVTIPSGETLNFDEVDAGDPLMTLKCLIESTNSSLGPVSSFRLALKGQLLADDDASLSDVQYQEGDVLVLTIADGDATASAAGGKGAGKGPDRPGTVPITGFEAVQITVSKCTNEKSNGVYVPAKPYAGKAVWFKAPSEDEDMPDAADDKPKSKDRGKRVIYYSAKSEKWFVGDELEEGGFSFATSPGKSDMPPLQGWHNGCVVEFSMATSASEGDLNAPAALVELVNLNKIEPWADQEVCYVTMLKVLNNIATNPTEAKFFSLKIENAAIQNKILRFDGSRRFLEAVGFRENAGALVLPLERSEQAKLAHKMLEGFANEANYQNIRKERHAAAKEEIKKEAAMPKRPGPRKDLPDYSEKGSGKGPMRG